MAEHVIGNDATRVQFSFSAQRLKCKNKFNIIYGNKKKSIYQIDVRGMQKGELFCAQVQNGKDERRGAKA